jgi:uncharacterized protein YdaU (DUF1376 family)
LNYFNLYPGDYLRDTTDLSLAEHGAYCLLLMHYYAKGGALDADPARLMRICSAVTDEEQFAVRSVLDRFFSIRNGKLWNRKADKEIAKAMPRIRAARENGATGGRPRKNPAGNPVGLATETQRVTQWPTQQGTQQATHAGVGVGVGVGAKAAFQEEARALVVGERS